MESDPTPPGLILMGEYGTDPDEQLSLILASRLHHMGLVDLLAVVGNHAPALNRAQSAKSTLTDLGLGYVPVGAGEASFSASTPGYETDPSFLSPATRVQCGPELLHWVLRQSAPQSLVLVVNSGFTDVARLWLCHSDLFLDRVRSVVMMSGIELDGEVPQLSKYGGLVPSLGKGGAANNCFHPGATQMVYQDMQSQGVPLIVTTRHAAYQAKLPLSLYVNMADTGHPLGQKLYRSQREEINKLWEKVCAAAGSSVRGTLPVDRNPQWFADTFCKGAVPPVASGGDVSSYILELALYDPMNIIAACPALVSQFYDPFDVGVPSARGTTVHQVIGLSPDQHGVSDPEGLKTFMSECLVQALTRAQAATAAETR